MMTTIGVFLERMDIAMLEVIVAKANRNDAAIAKWNKTLNKACDDLALYIEQNYGSR